MTCAGVSGGGSDRLGSAKDLGDVAVQRFEAEGREGARPGRDYHTVEDGVVVAAREIRPP